MLGAAGGSLIQGLFGKKKAPEYTPYQDVDVGAAAGQAIQGNLNNMDNISSLVKATNSLNQAQRNSMLNSAMPGWSSMSRAMTGAFGNYMDSMGSGGMYGLPQDFQSNLERLAAERGISAGTRGQFSDFSLLRDFGVNQLNYAQGQAALMNSMTNSLMSIANFNTVAPSQAQAFFVTPEQQIAQTQQANYLNWAGRNQNNAAVADAWNWNRQNLVGGISNAMTYFGGAMDSGINTGFAIGDDITANSAMMTNSVGNLLQGAGSVMGGIGMMCWVAREVYGAENPRWLRFRDWMVNRAPKWVRDVYEKNGPRAAEMVRNNPGLRGEMRNMMDRIMAFDDAGVVLEGA